MSDTAAARASDFMSTLLAHVIVGAAVAALVSFGWWAAAQFTGADRDYGLLFFVAWSAAVAAARWRTP